MGQNEIQNIMIDEKPKLSVFGALRRPIKRRLRRLDLPQKFSFHSFRAAFATSWLESNLSIDALQKIGAWANLDTVKRYDRNTQEASISEMETMKI